LISLAIGFKSCEEFTTESPENTEKDNRLLFFFFRVFRAFRGEIVLG
jgi:hypothetical protein